MPTTKHPSFNKLIEKLQTITKPTLPQLATGHSDTISDFFNTFSQQYKFNPKTVLAIHRALVEYVNKPDAMLAIRFFHTQKPELYHTLRRGWLTHTDQDYSFFYTDNFYAAYYAKMALDNFTFTADDLLQTHLDLLFPSRFGPWTSEEKEKYAVQGGKNPGFTTAGLKIAHIFAVAEDPYIYQGNKFTLSKIITEFFNGGERNDYQTNEQGIYARRNFHVPQHAKQFLIAHFLRFVDPLNYIILPKTTCEDFGGRGIAEHKPLLAYAQAEMHKIYGEEYTNFLNLIMAPQQNTTVDSNEILDINYGLNIKNKTPNTQTHITPPAHTGTQKLKISQLVKQQLIPKLTDTAVSSTDIANFMNKEFCKKTFGINYPLLSHTRFINGRPRYYANQILINNKQYYLCQEWYEHSYTKLESWLNQ